MLKIVSENFIHALLLFLGLFLKISRWVPLTLSCSFSGSFPHLFISAYIRENTITIQICNKKVENKVIKFFTWNKPSDFRVYNDTFNCEVDAACYVAIIFL